MLRLGLSVLLLATCSSAGAPPAMDSVSAEARASGAPAGADLVVFEGMCDASAAVAVPGGLVVADDESNRLRRYGSSGGAPTVGADLSMPAGATPKDGAFRELDLEGAARIGETVFWIGSHGHNKKGKPRPGRHRLLATTLAGADATVVGRFDDLIAHLPGLGLGAPGVPPKEVGGTNIEGLAATPDGALLVGFRSPIVDGRALVVRLGNPTELTGSSPTEPRVDEVAHLDLGGLGVRSLEWSPSREAVFIVAGPRAGGGPFRLYRWSGRASDPAVEQTTPELPGDFAPEALFEADGRLWLLSDDGTRDVGGTPCKEVEPARRSFRGVAFPAP